MTKIEYTLLWLFGVGGFAAALVFLVAWLSARDEARHYRRLTIALNNRLDEHEPGHNQETLLRMVGDRP